LHYNTAAESWACKSWLFFQVSGQGPYSGQLNWFENHHPGPKVASAIDRYTKEVERMLTVLDTRLAENGTGWLVGDRLTYVDLAFLPYATITGNGGLVGKELDTGRWKQYSAWIAKMRDREAVKVVAGMLDDVWQAVKTAQEGAHK
jgi:glutathione S-transferase